MRTVDGAVPGLLDVIPGERPVEVRAAALQAAHVAVIAVTVRAVRYEALHNDGTLATLQVGRRTRVATLQPEWWGWWSKRREG